MKRQEGFFKHLATPRLAPLRVELARALFIPVLRPSLPTLTGSCVYNRVNCLIPANWVENLVDASRWDGAGGGGEISGREKTGYTVVPFNGLYDVGMERGLFINMRTVVPDQFPSNTCWYPRSYPDAGEIFNTISDRCYPPRCIDDNVAFFLETEKMEDVIYSLVPCPFSRLFLSSFFLFFPTCPCSNGKRDGGPKNKSIILGRLVHLFPTLHNIPLGGLRTLFLLIALSLLFYSSFYLRFSRVPAGSPFKTDFGENISARSEKAFVPRISQI